MAYLQWLLWCVATTNQPDTPLLFNPLNTSFSYTSTENSLIKGFTRNPYHLDYAVGGSSGGTGAAIAAGYCAAGLGTDTGCSVRAPASINNLVGLRPTHGLIDMKGVMPMNADWDTVGPMARSVRDLATLLDVLLGTADETMQTDNTILGPNERAACEALGTESGLDC